jgi:hypothetical protein
LYLNHKILQLVEPKGTPFLEELRRKYDFVLDIRKATKRQYGKEEVVLIKNSVTETKEITEVTTEKVNVSDS